MPSESPTSDHEATVTLADEVCVVVDDLLAPGEWDLVWNYFQVQSFRRVDDLGLQGHWSLEDGVALRGPSVGYGHEEDGRFPTGTPVDLIMSAVLEIRESFASVAGHFERDWQTFNAFAALYTRDVGLLWHRDSEEFTGSYTYYAHRAWNVEWGGELLLAQADVPRDYGVYFHKLRPTANETEPIAWKSHLDNADANELLMDPGLGRFIMPKPNRLVVIRGGVPHAVSKVRKSAGSAVRASVSGFFRRSLPEPS